MIKRIKRNIRDFGFDDYKIIEYNVHEHQLYLLEKSLESKRTVESHYYEITVYKDHREKEHISRGEYTFTYKPNTDLKAHLEQARLACSMIKNRHYRLMDPTGVPSVRVLDPRLANAELLGEQLTDIIYRNSPGAHVCLSSAELYLKKATITMMTSTGIEATKEKGLIEIETTLIGEKANQEQEMSFHLSRRNVDDLGLDKRLKEYGEHARKMFDVKVPRTGNATVAFSTADIYLLMRPVIFHSSGRSKDNAISRFAEDNKITADAMNSFTLMSSGVLPFGLYTEPFDNDGIPAREHTIIDHGVFKKYWATKRYADYLGVEPTGDFKNLIIKPDISVTFDANDYYEIVQFSDLSPDPITGDFVAEIRFGYHVRNGQRSPIKGGSASGNIFEALRKTYFTDDSVFEGNYLGPKTIAFKDLSISGQ
jgi:predicted Zn-dependent protease